MRRIATILLVALLVAACDGDTSVGDAEVTADDQPPLYPFAVLGSGWTVAGNGVWITEPPAWRHPEFYADELGITVDEANRRNRWADELDDRSTWMENRPWFGGVWTEETADDWWAIIATTDPDKAARQVANRLAGVSVLPLIEYRQVDQSVQEMERHLEFIERLIAEWCLPPPTRTRIDRYHNEMIVGVQDVEEFTTAANIAEIRVADYVIEEHRVERPPEPATTCGVSAAELAAARPLWEEQGVDHYTFKVTGRSEWGSRGLHRVTVSGEQVTVEVLEPGSGIFLDKVWDRGTFDDVFDWIGDIWHPYHLRVEIHPQRGFVSSVRYRVPGVVDEEWWLSIYEFTPTEP